MTSRLTFKGRNLFERRQNVNRVVSDEEALCFKKKCSTTLDSLLPGDEAPSGIKAKKKKASERAPRGMVTFRVPAARQRSLRTD